MSWQIHHVLNFPCVSLSSSCFVAKEKLFSTQRVLFSRHAFNQIEDDFDVFAVENPWKVVVVTPTSFPGSRGKACGSLESFNLS
jgi:hypothetical protein